MVAKKTPLPLWPRSHLPPAFLLKEQQLMGSGQVKGRQDAGEAQAQAPAPAPDLKWSRAKPVPSHPSAARVLEFKDKT